MARCFAKAGKSSLPSNRSVTLANSNGQNGSAGRSFGLAYAAMTASLAAIAARIDPADALRVSHGADDRGAAPTRELRRQ
jgi:hypothetical protein